MTTNDFEQSFRGFSLKTARYRRSRREVSSTELFNSADDDFYSVKANSTHVLQPYLPDQTNIPYRLRTRPHNMTMINKSKFLNDTDFIIRMLHKCS